MLCRPHVRTRAGFRTRAPRLPARGVRLRRQVPEYKPATTLAFISAFVKGEAYKRYTPPPTRLSQRAGAAMFPDVVHSEL